LVELLRHVIDPQEAGQRADQFVRSRVTASRSTVRAWFSEGYVLINNRPASKGQSVVVGDEVRVVEVPKTPPTSPTALDIRLETPRVLVIHKPAGQPSVALGSSHLWALSQAITAVFPASAGVGYGPLDAGLLHRLDNDTSGLLVAAKQQPAFDELLEGLRGGQLGKRYLALVSAPPPAESGSISHALEPHPTHRRKVALAAPGSGHGHPARTDFRVLASGNGVWLLELSASTAYRHQIRVHLASLGCPLLSDALYGGAAWPGLTRHALHASAIRWLGGPLVPAFSVEAELPADLRAVLDAAGLVYADAAKAQ
jgi:23S rRNA pseudouridine1911/1915/1917 synthase